MHAQMAAELHIGKGVADHHGALKLKIGEFPLSTMGEMGGWLAGIGVLLCGIVRGVNAMNTNMVTHEFVLHVLVNLLNFRLLHQSFCDALLIGHDENVIEVGLQRLEGFNDPGQKGKLCYGLDVTLKFADVEHAIAIQKEG